MISTKDLFLVPLTFVNNLSWWPDVAVNVMNCHPMKTGPNYRIKLFSLFLEGLSFDIYLRGIFTGVLVLELVFITFRKFSRMYIRACESFTALNEQYCHIIQVSNGSIEVWVS